MKGSTVKVYSRDGDVNDGRKPRGTRDWRRQQQVEREASPPSVRARQTQPDDPDAALAKPIE